MASTDHDLNALLQMDAVSRKQALQQWDKETLIKYLSELAPSNVPPQSDTAALLGAFNTTHEWYSGLALIEEIGQNLSSTLDLNEVLIRLLRRVHDAIDVSDGSILLIEEASGDLVSQVVLGSISDTSNPFSNKPFRVPRGQGIAGEVALTGVPIVVNDAQEDSRHFKAIDQDTGFLTESILCVPLVTRDKIIGVLEVFNKRSGPFTEEDQIMLSSIANYAAIAIENARLHQSVIEDRDRIIKAQEEVSRNLQRDLHDGPTQLVAAIQMGIDFCNQAIGHQQPELALQELDNMHQLAQRATHQMRTLLFQLRPLVLETEGLMPALSTFRDRRQAEHDDVKIHLDCSSDKADGQISRLRKEAEAALFAIVQEAVNNALKYAKADNIFIILHQEDKKLSVTVLDDGIGFDVAEVMNNYEARGSYGMVNLRDRVEVANGNYTLKSAIGGGTELRVRVPVVSPEAEPEALAA